MKQQRFEWVDNLKGIGMILVVLGHAYIPMTENKYILSFHMPLFFLISGYLFNFGKNNNFLFFIKKKIKTLLIPYFSFAFITYFFWLIVERKFKLGDNNNISISKPLIGIFYSINQYNYMVFDGVLWFLTCLFVVEIFFYTINKNITKQRNLMISLVILSIVGYLSSLLLPVRLPWNADVALTAIVFYGAGFLFKSNIERVRMKPNKFKIFVIISCIVINIIFVNINQVVFMFENQYGNYICFYMASFSGIMVFTIISMMIKGSKILKFIGTNSLVMLALHQKIYTILSYLIRHIFKLADNSFTNSFLWGSIFTILIIIVLVPVTLIINKFFPVILGKNKSIVNII